MSYSLNCNKPKARDICLCVQSETNSTNVHCTCICVCIRYRLSTGGKLFAVCAKQFNLQRNKRAKIYSFKYRRKIRNNHFYSLAMHLTIADEPNENDQLLLLCECVLRTKERRWNKMKTKTRQRCGHRGLNIIIALNWRFASGWCVNFSFNSLLDPRSENKFTI